MMKNEMIPIIMKWMRKWQKEIKMKAINFIIVNCIKI